MRDFLFYLSIRNDGLRNLSVNEKMKDMYRIWEEVEAIGRVFSDLWENIDMAVIIGFVVVLVIIFGKRKKVMGFTREGGVKEYWNRITKKN